MFCPIGWSEEVDAFNALKEDVTKATLSATEDDIPIRVGKEASDFVISATLSQVVRPVAFFSLILSKSEQKHLAI